MKRSICGVAWQRRWPRAFGGRAQGLRRGASAIKCYYAARGISTTAVAGLRVPANAIASGSINIDRGRRRAHEDLPERQPPRGQSSLHRRRPGFPPELQRPMRSDEVVITAQQLQVVLECLLRACVAWRPPTQLRRPLTNCEGEPLDKRRVQCRRVLGVIEGFIESPRSSNQRSSFDLHDTIIPARLENLAVQSRWTKDATDSVTLFS